MSQLCDMYRSMAGQVSDAGVQRAKRMDDETDGQRRTDGSTRHVDMWPLTPDTGMCILMFHRGLSRGSTGHGRLQSDFSPSKLLAT